MFKIEKPRDMNGSKFSLTLTDWAPIPTLSDRGGGGALIAPPPSISGPVTDNDVIFFLVVHVYF